MFRKPVKTKGMLPNGEVGLSSGGLEPVKFMLKRDDFNRLTAGSEYVFSTNIFISD